MDAGLDFHWPHSTSEDVQEPEPLRPKAPPPRPPDPHRAAHVEGSLAQLLERSPAHLVALADRAESERQLRTARAQVRRLEHALAAARQEVEASRSLLEAQRLRMQALALESAGLRRELQAVVAPPRARRVPTASARPATVVPLEPTIRAARRSPA